MSRFFAVGALPMDYGGVHEAIRDYYFCPLILEILVPPRHVRMYVLCMSAG